MKRILIIIMLFVVGLTACKKDKIQPETLTPAAEVVFDGNYSYTGGTYWSQSDAAAAKGTGTVSIAMTYKGDIKTMKFTTVTGSVVNDLGTITPTGGVYTFTKLVKDLRGTADAPLPTSGTSGSVVLTVTLNLGDGTTLKRLYNITVTSAKPAAVR
jgi:hypothetical protein